jgi:hypothetical protein
VSAVREQALVRIGECEDLAILVYPAAPGARHFAKIADRRIKQKTMRIALL